MFQRSAYLLATSQNVNRRRLHQKKSHAPVLVALSLFGALSFSLPYFYLRSNANSANPISTTQEEALPVNTVRRGPFLNSGSRDIGFDKLSKTPDKYYHDRK